MKKIYLQSRDKQHWYDSWALILIALVFAIIVSPARIPATRLVIFTSTPFWYAGKYIAAGTESFISGFSNNRKLVAENKALKSNTAVLAERLSYISVLQDENDDLKNLLGRKGTAVFSSTTVSRLCPPADNAIGALVILSPENSYYNSMLVDVGSIDGVSKGDKVYSFGDIVLGAVSDVYPHKSRVVLYSAAKVSTPVFLSKENITMTLEGDGAGTFIAKLPKSTSVKRGDRATLPVGRLSLVAVVEQVRATEDAPFETIYLKSPANLHSLKWVYVDRQTPAGKTSACLNVAF